MCHNQKPWTPAGAAADPRRQIDRTPRHARHKRPQRPTEAAPRRSWTAPTRAQPRAPGPPPRSAPAANSAKASPAAVKQHAHAPTASKQHAHAVKTRTSPDAQKRPQEPRPPHPIQTKGKGIEPPHAPTQTVTERRDHARRRPPTRSGEGPTPAAIASEPPTIGGIIKPTGL